MQRVLAKLHDHSLGYKGTVGDFFVSSMSIYYQYYSMDGSSTNMLKLCNFFVNLEDKGFCGRIVDYWSGLAGLYSISTMCVW